MAVLTGARRLLAVLAALTAFAGLASAQPGDAGERVVKAAFLYNFTKYVEWPDAAFTGTSAPFVVCVVAEEPFLREVTTTMKNEQVRGRRVEVAAPGPDDDLRTCHLVYFSGAQAERAPSRLTAVRQAPVLTVGEGPRFLDEGGVIAFARVENRVRFDISKRAADGSRLVVSSKLLRVARRVIGESLP